MKQLNYLSIATLFFSILSLQSQVINQGNLKINSLTVVSIADEYTNAATGVHNNEGDLNLYSNFINHGTTVASSGITRFNSSSQEIQYLSGTSNSINLYDLEINLSTINKKGLQVASGFGVIMANQLLLQNGDLRLMDDAQLVQSHSGTDTNVIGTANILADQQGIASAYAFKYWSAPVNNGGDFSLSGGLFDGGDSNLNPFAPQQVLFNTGSPFNGLPAVKDGGGNVTTPLTVNTYWTFTYYSPADWNAINESSTINPGLGFTMKGTNTSDTDQNYVFKGAPNNGDYQIAVNANESVLLGNPYPSSIDVHQFITDNLGLFDGSVYYWVDGGTTSHVQADYLGGYAVRNLVAGAPPSVIPNLIGGLGSSSSADPPTQFMPIGQGFFIDTSASGNVEFNNGQRVFKNENTNEAISYSRNTQKTNSQNSLIRLGFEDPEGFHRQIVLGFVPNSGATLNYDPGYDALMIDAKDDDMFFIIENDTTKKYAIQGIGTYDNTYEFPLGMVISEVGIQTIMLDDTENFNDTVYIRDELTLATHNLNEGDMSIQLAPGNYFDRYTLVFEASSLSNPEYSLVDLQAYFSNTHLKIHNPNKLAISKVSVHNLLGQRLVSVTPEDIDSSELSVPFNEATGIYIVEIQTNNGKQTIKTLKQ